MPLHPQRADVLAVLTLAVRRREPLPEAIERIAQADPHLGRWSARLAPALRAGEPVGSVLRRHRLVTRREAERLDRDPATLPAVAAGTFHPVADDALLRWYPVLLLAAAILPAVALGRLLAWSIGGNILRDFGIPFGSWLVRLVHGGWGESLGGAALLLGGAAIATWAAWRIRDTRTILLHLFAGRQRMLLQLAEDAHTGTDSWRAAWDEWWPLVRDRLSAEERAAVVGLPGLRERLVLLGLVPLDDGVPRWSSLIEETRAAWLRVWRPQRAVLIGVLIVCGLTGSILLVMLPLLRFGSGGGLSG